MCKREALAMEGENKDSEYYIWDIIQQKLKCVWAKHQLFDGDYQPKFINAIFYKEDGIIFFIDIECM